MGRPAPESVEEGKGPGGHRLGAKGLFFKRRGHLPGQDSGQIIRERDLPHLAAAEERDGDALVRPPPQDLRPGLVRGRDRLRHGDKGTGQEPGHRQRQQQSKGQRQQGDQNTALHI